MWETCFQNVHLGYDKSLAKQMAADPLVMISLRALSISCRRRSTNSNFPITLQLKA